MDVLYPLPGALNETPDTDAMRRLSQTGGAFNGRRWSDCCFAWNQHSAQRDLDLCKQAKGAAPTSGPCARCGGLVGLVSERTASPTRAWRYNRKESV